MVDADEVAAGETLPASISALREYLGAGTALRDIFDDRLLDAGYLDSEAVRFEARRFAIRSRQCFKVVPGFPRLLEANLPVGVGDVSYALSLAACAPFEVSVDAMIATIQASAGIGSDE